MKTLLLKVIEFKDHYKTSHKKHNIKSKSRAQKKLKITICFFLLIGLSINAQDFITTWETTTANETITLPNSGAPSNYNFNIDWGDGLIENNVNTPGKQHTYVTPGIYTVRINGQFEEFDFTGIPTSTSANNLLSVDQWGSLAVSKLSFSGATRFQINDINAPDLSNITSFDNLFSGASTVNADLSNWDVSRITSMNETFRDATSFNGNITTWDTGEVTNMTSMFSGASVFDQNIGGWNISKVTNMSTMFFNAIAFNEDIGGWNTNEVINMTGMFNGATAFNQNIGGWITSKVTDMDFMFNSATAFNGDISGWDTSNVLRMNFMFASADKFNQNIGGWTTSKVTTMSSMFAGADSFNQDISGWDVSIVRTMAFMFANARSFNQDISRWDISSVTSMSFMFDTAIAFNQNIGDWNISNVASLFRTLSNSGLSTLNYDATLIGWANQTVRSGINLGAEGLAYCLSNAAHNILTSAPNSWTINDDGLNCSSLFITTWSTTTANEIITLPNDDNGGLLQYDFSIDWGDGTPIETNVTTPTATHTYTTPGIYTVRIDGVFRSFDFETVPVNNINILSVEQWGDLTVTKLNFRDAINFQINAIDAPDLSNVTSFTNLFRQASTVNADLSNWNVSTITDMQNAFDGATAFNGNISTWNTSSVENMSTMFNNATAFNQDISNWDTSNVVKMDYMFSNAIAFNQNIETSGVNWDTSKVDDMKFMFNNATAFNKDISNWTTNTVTDMSSMFENATTFNQNIGGWNTTAVTNISNMFNNASAFNQNLGNWNISNILSMTGTLSNSALSTQNYDATLIGWASQTVQPRVRLGADGLTYCLGGDAREKLINDSSWVITGDMFGCSSLLTYSITKTTDAVEGTSNATFTVSIDGGLTNTTGRIITGTLRLTGTATNGTDYTNVTTFSIAVGDSNVIVTIPVIDDSNVELQETIIATISAPNIGSINSTNNFDTATITDDDGTALTISVGSPTNAIEGTSNATFTVSLDGGLTNATGAPITGTLTFTGTATNGTDYTNIATFSIADGNNDVIITIPIIDDTNVELQETIIATISAPNIGNINAINNSATATITDDDSGALTISIGSPVDAVEGISDATFTVSLDGGLTNATGAPITGTLTLNGTATNGTDYTNVTTFSIADGNTNTIVIIPVINDTEVEPLETIIATVSAPSIGNINTTNNSDTATITDDDGAALTYSITKTTDAIEGTSDATFTVSIDGGTNNTTGAPITGTLILTGTATNGTDYTNVTTFSIAVGDSNVIVTIPVIDDSNVELQETIIATISTPNIGSINSTNNFDTATITDDDGTALTISIGSPTNAIEGTSNATFTVSLDGGLTNATGAPITGTLTFTGTATNGTDYTNIATFSIADGNNDVIITIPIIDDTNVELQETIIATISAPNIGNINAINNSATATITDDDSGALTISIGSPVDAVEGTSDAAFTVSLDNGVFNATGTPITGIITLTGTATSGIDYTNVIAFSIANGDRNIVITIPIINDIEIEPQETIIATISAPNIGNINTINNSVTAIITDDDVPPNPNLALSKTGVYEDINNDGVLNTGDQIVYTFIIENNGNEIITDIMITDPLSGIVLSGESIDLAPGEIDDSTFTAIYELTENDILNSNVTNQAFVTGIDPTNIEIIDFSDDPNNDTNIDDDGDGDGEDPTITELNNKDELTIYEIITPNGDGLNDELRISGLVKYPNNNIVIYNRWGAKVFEADGYEQKGTPLFKGLAKGKKNILPTGAYFFTLQYQNSIGAAIFKSGYLHIN